ncbi:hypothetical protein DAMA08_017690 [Martiniozyma asiatica (nom. inval.)]|nr:hypothetical protein DAMA08_017690 [Martiniozyma asiatica]
MNTDEGSIYVFTLEHFLSNRNSNRESLRLADASVRGRPMPETSDVFDSRKTVLIKVGYTKQDPVKRVNQWRRNCNHSDFVLLKPGTLFPKVLKDTSLIRLFARLSVADADLKFSKRKYKHMNAQSNAFFTKEVYKTEQEIHKILRKTYGSGKVFCDGCRGTTNKKGIHHEWFCVPRKEMENIWKIIEKKCS